MKYRLISMDLDGTLLTDDQKVSDQTRKSLEMYKNNHYIIVGVTARNIESVKSVCDISLFDYLILNNGGYTYNVINKAEEDKVLLDLETASSITKEMKNFCEQIDFCTVSSYYCYLNSNVIENHFVKKISSLSQISGEVLRMNLFLFKQEEIREKEDLLNRKYQSINCFVMQDSNSNLQRLVIMPKGINKKTALENLGNKLHIKLEEMIFFGDGLNDLEIIESVGMGVAMGNALESVKKCAKEVTKSNNEDGIEYFLNQHIPLKEI